MQKTTVSTCRKPKLIRQGNEKRRAILAEVVYKTPVGKAKNGKTKYRSVTKHELQHLVDYRINKQVWRPGERGIAPSRIKGTLPGEDKSGVSGIDIPFVRLGTNKKRIIIPI